MKLLIPVLALAFLLVGCEKIEGHLNITKDLKLKNTKGKTLITKVGTYNADVTGNSSKKFTLRLNNDSDQQFVFKHSSLIPENGTFSIGAKESGQPVDISGDVNTIRSNSEVRENRDSCTYQVRRRVCRPLPNGRTECEYEYRTVMGFQWVRYYVRTTSQNFNLDVKSIGSTSSVADFHGDISSSVRVIIYESECR